MKVAFSCVMSWLLIHSIHTNTVMNVQVSQNLCAREQDCLPAGEGIMCKICVWVYLNVIFALAK